MARQQQHATPPPTPPPPADSPPPTPPAQHVSRAPRRGADARSPTNGGLSSERPRRTRSDGAPPAGTPKAVAPIPFAEEQTAAAPLYIAHDNGPLGDAMTRLGGRGEVLVETKRGALLCLVYGRVRYSGPVEAARSVGGALLKGDRGSLVLELDRCHARLVDLASRTRPGSSDFECLSLLDGAPVPFSTADDVRAFFAGCESRVDVILSPQRFRDDGKQPKSAVAVDEAPFCPYWDTDVPPRKLAPQFRSAGVGYIRLGDDMSRNGLAFVSCDGSSFISDAGGAEPPPSAAAVSVSRARLRGSQPRYPGREPATPPSPACSDSSAVRAGAKRLNVHKW